MEQELTNTKDFLQNLSDIVHLFVMENVSSEWVTFFLILSKFLLFTALVYLVDFVVKYLVIGIFTLINRKKKSPILHAIQKAKLSRSIAHLIALIFGRFSFHSIFYTRPSTYTPIQIVVEIALVLVSAGMTFRFLKAIEYYYLFKKNFYRIMAFRAINQTVKIFGIFIFSVIAISIIFGISGTTILGSLGAITAVMVLIFRDTILGFVTGIHVATSKNLKVGDWIGIPKYNLEGTIQDIDLLTTKILNFDKTISTIPTYDLLSTEIKNLQVMSETNTRRIKKSIYFNINSFKFINQEMFQKLKEINLISDYLDQKSQEISESKKNTNHYDKIINGAQLTNIGIFRYYAMQYLKQNKNVDTQGSLMVRQLDITPHGLPLEIYCFANDSKWEHFEQIQADIFDHLLVASKNFDLEVVQYSKI